MYDTFGEIQIKAGACEGNQFKIGDIVDLENGVYVAPDGVVVIIDHRFAAKFDKLIDKWGGDLSPEEITNQNNPILGAIKEVLGEVEKKEE